MKMVLCEVKFVGLLDAGIGAAWREASKGKCFDLSDGVLTLDVAPGVAIYATSRRALDNIDWDATVAEGMLTILVSGWQLELTAVNVGGGRFKRAGWELRAGMAPGYGAPK